MLGVLRLLVVPNHRLASVVGRRHYAHHFRATPSKFSRRMMTTPAPQVNASDIPMDRYHVLSDAIMNNLLESLESLLDQIGNHEYEVEYHSGVLTLLLGEKGTYVINKQPPNKQIWLSSPFSGPKRYDYSETDDNWVYSRDGRGLTDLLDEELGKALGQTVKMDLRRPVANCS